MRTLYRVTSSTKSVLAASRSCSLLSAPPSSSSEFITNSRFEDLQIHSNTKRAIKDVMKYEFMTHVQEASLPPLLIGGDCLARAKTGTGKTMAFLVPTIEKILKIKSTQGRAALTAVIISPTRELAMQIAAEAKTLLTFHRDLSVECFVGGTNISTDKKKLTSSSLSLLVATPGRLLDLLQNTTGFSELCKSNVGVLVMDEADKLLEMGFKQEIDKILTYMPDKMKRQTLLFSATVAPEILAIAKISLNPNYSIINTVGEDTDQTHQHVPQQVIVSSLSDMTLTIASAIEDHMKEKKTFKIIVFYTTARLTGFMSELFVEMGYNTLEMHSRKSQSQRVKISQQFKDSKNVILFTSDVTARGMDYPDVTYVIQVGLTERAQYIHRLGRTARAGKDGKGLLILAPFEEKVMLKDLEDMSLEPTTTSPSDDLQKKLSKTFQKVKSNTNLNQSAEKAYGAWLGFYNGNLKKCGWDKKQLVATANNFALTLGLHQAPALEKRTISKMGLSGTPGLFVK